MQGSSSVAVDCRISCAAVKLGWMEVEAAWGRKGGEREEGGREGRERREGGREGKRTL